MDRFVIRDEKMEKCWLIPVTQKRLVINVCSLEIVKVDGYGQIHAMWTIHGTVGILLIWVVGNFSYHTRSQKDAPEFGDRPLTRQETAIIMTVT